LPCEASAGGAGGFAAIAAPQDMPQAAITAVIELCIENTRKLPEPDRPWRDIAQLISSISSYF